MKINQIRNWSEVAEDNIDRIKLTSDQIHFITSMFSEKRYIRIDDGNNCLENIESALDCWAGCTYVGERKEAALSSAFQNFFDVLYAFLIIDKDYAPFPIKEFTTGALYKGKLYRYLGHGEGSSDKESVVNPECDGVWVSWSKNKDNSYFNGKLYGPMTQVVCNTGDKYGIDLSALNVSRGVEAEVVFPTLKECIISVQYL